MTTEAIDPQEWKGTRPRSPPWIGNGLLGDNWANGRDWAINSLQAAYSRVAEDPVGNLGVWLKVRESIRDYLHRKLRSVGLESAPMYEDAIMDRIAPYRPQHDDEAHVALVAALLTDYGPRFAEHIEYRHANHGNVHLEITGKTGTAKSSCAISIADWIRPIDPEKLIDHVNFDLNELPKRLEKKQPRETVIQDEFISVAGDGARTQQMLFANLEDTLRASGVNLFVLSPRRHEHATMQAVLEAVAWNPSGRWTAFLVYVDGKPRGLVPVPWCRSELWEPYSAFKKRNIQRTLSGQFKDLAAGIRQGVRLLDEPNVQWWLLDVIGRPKKGDFEDAIRLSSGHMMTVSERGFIAEMMYAACKAYDKIGDELEERFGVPPTEGLKKVAKAIGKKA